MDLPFGSRISGVAMFSASTVATVLLLPGSENYRQVILHLPAHQHSKPGRTTLPAVHSHFPAIDGHHGLLIKLPYLFGLVNRLDNTLLAIHGMAVVYTSDHPHDVT